MLTTNDIIERLRDKMGEKQYERLIGNIEAEFNELISDEKNRLGTLEQLYQKYVYPQIRQHGLKTEIKSRTIFYEMPNINLFRYNSEMGQMLQKELREKDSKFDDLDFEIKFRSVVELGMQRSMLYQAEHISLWINGKIYHWGPGEKWRMYGEEETNKEVTNDWKTHNEYNNVYFTLYTHEELMKYCDHWKKENQFDATDASYKFGKALIDYLGLVEFSS